MDISPQNNKKKTKDLNGAIDPFTNLAPTTTDRDVRLPLSQRSNFSRFDYKNDFIPYQGASQKHLKQDRANRQGGGEVFMNTLGGIVAGGAGLIIEDTGLMLDLLNFSKEEEQSKEIWYNAMSEWGAEFRKRAKEDWFPIHKESDDIWSAEWETFATMFRDLGEQAIGFAIPGGAAAKTVSYSLKGMKMLRALPATSKTLEKLSRLGTAFIQNYAEGKMIALQTYEEVLNENQTLVDRGKMTEEKQKKLASEAANEVFNKNKFFIATNYLSAAGMFRSNGMSRNIIKDPKSLNTFASNRLKETAIESFEEIGQGNIQREAGYKARIQSGDYESVDFADRINAYFQEPEMWYEGVLGGLGGMFEVAAIKRMINPPSDSVTQYEEQQSNLESIKKNTKTIVENQAEKDKLRKEAIERGEPELVDHINQKETLSMIARAFKTGTTSALEKQLDAIIEEGGKNAQTAQKIKDTMLEQEKKYIRSTRYNNPTNAIFQYEEDGKLKTEKVRGIFDIESTLSLAEQMREYYWNFISDEALNNKGSIFEKFKQFYDELEDTEYSEENKDNKKVEDFLNSENVNEADKSIINQLEHWDQKVKSLQLELLKEKSFERQQEIRRLINKSKKYAKQQKEKKKENASRASKKDSSRESTKEKKKAKAKAKKPKQPRGEETSQADDDASSFRKRTNRKPTDEEENPMGKPKGSMGSEERGKKNDSKNIMGEPKGKRTGDDVLYNESKNKPKENQEESEESEDSESVNKPTKETEQEDFKPESSEEKIEKQSNRPDTIEGTDLEIARTVAFSVAKVHRDEDGEVTQEAKNSANLDDVQEGTSLEFEVTGKKPDDPVHAEIIVYAVQGDSRIKLGYVHDLDYLHQYHSDLSQEARAKATKELADFREMVVFSSDEFGRSVVTSNISFTSNGSLSKVYTDTTESETAYGKIKYRIDNNQLEFVFADSSSQFKDSQNENININHTLRKNPIPGVIYMLVPVNKKGKVVTHAPIPVKQTRVGNSDLREEIKNTIRIAIDIWTGRKIEDEHLQLQKAYQKQGIDLTTTAGFNKFLTLFINDYSIKFTTDDIINEVKADDHFNADEIYVALQKNSIEFIFGDGKTVSGSHFITQDENVNNTEAIEIFLEQVLPSQRINLTIKENTPNTILINERGGITELSPKDHLEEFGLVDIQEFETENGYGYNFRRIGIEVYNNEEIAGDESEQSSQQVESTEEQAQEDEQDEFLEETGGLNLSPAENDLRGALIQLIEDNPELRNEIFKAAGLQGQVNLPDVVELDMSSFDKELAGKLQNLLMDLYPNIKLVVSKEPVFEVRKQDVRNQTRGREEFVQNILDRYSKATRFLKPTIDRFNKRIKEEHLSSAGFGVRNLETKTINKKPLKKNQLRYLKEAAGYQKIVPELNAYSKIKEKYGERPISLNSPIKVKGVKKHELKIVNLVRNMISDNNPDVKSIDADSLIAEVQLYMEYNNFISFAYMGENLDYRITSIFQYSRFEHKKIGIYYNDQTYLPTKHFKNQPPLAFGNYTYFTKEDGTKAVLLHEFQSDPFGFLFKRISDTKKLNNTKLTEAQNTNVLIDTLFSTKRYPQFLKDAFKAAMRESRSALAPNVLIEEIKNILEKRKSELERLEIKLNEKSAFITLYVTGKLEKIIEAFKNSESHDDIKNEIRSHLASVGSGVISNLIDGKSVTEEDIDFAVNSVFNALYPLIFGPRRRRGGIEDWDARPTNTHSILKRVLANTPSKKDMIIARSMVKTLNEYNELNYDEVTELIDTIKYNLSVLSDYMFEKEPEKQFPVPNKEVLADEQNYINHLFDYIVREIKRDNNGKLPELYFSGFNTTMLTQGAYSSAQLYAGPEEIGDIIDGNKIENVGPVFAQVSKIKGISLVYEEDMKSLQEHKLSNYNIKQSAYKIDLSDYDTDAPIMYQKNEVDNIIGQANLKAMSVLIDAINQNQDTLPHEYAHHYIHMFRDSEIVKEGIKRFGSEEALVQAIGEQVVKQEGEAYNWWKKFTNWILSLMSDREILQVLTDSFLQNVNLNQDFTYNEATQSQKNKAVSEYLEFAEQKVETTSIAEFLEKKFISEFRTWRADTEFDDGVDSLFSPSDSFVSDYVIEGIDPSSLRSITTNIARQFVFRSINQEEKLSFKEIIDEFMTMLDDLIVKYESEISKRKKANKQFDKISQALDKLKKMRNSRAEIVNLTMLKLQKFDVVATEKESLEDGESETFDNQNWNEDWALSINHQKNMSQQLKAIFSGIPERTVDGKTIKVLNGEKLMNADEIFYTTMRILSNHAFSNNLEEMLGVLRDHASLIPAMQDVADIISNASPQIQNEFMKVNTKSALKMQFVNFNRFNQEYFIKILRSDYNTQYQERMDNWRTNFLTREFITGQDDSKVKIKPTKENIDYFNSVAEQYENLTANLTVDGLYNWLADAGIHVDYKTIEDIKANGFKRSFKEKKPVEWKNILKANGIFKQHYKYINVIRKKLAEGEDYIVDRDNLFTDNFYLNLAKLDSKFGLDMTTASQKSGSKVLSTYNDYKYIDKRIDQISNPQTEEDFRAIKQLLSHPLLKLSRLQSAYNEDGTLNKQDEYASVIELAQMALSALKVNGRYIGDNTFSSHGPANIEMMKIALFLNNALYTKEDRTSKIVTPTLSDRKHAYTLEMQTQKVQLTDEGDSYSIDRDTIQTVYKEIVYSELNRIHQMSSDNPALQNYNKEAGESFWFFESLNDQTFRDGDGNESPLVLNGKLNPSHFNIEGNTFALNEDTREQLYRFVEKKIKNQVDRKVTYWKELGLLTKNKKKNPKYIDSRSYNSYPQALAKENETPAFTRDQSIAAEYVVNQMLSNTFFFKVVGGDPAIYWKRDRDTTKDNITKRLAGVASPKSTPVINPAFLEADNLKGKRNDIRMIVAQDVILDAQSQGALYNMFADYKKVNSTDAQEFYTIGHYIDILADDGQISLEMYNSIKRKWKKGEDLNVEELKTIRQPLKPFYYGDDIHGNKIMIKSSAVALVPQYVDGTPLGDLAEKMKNEKIDRVSFESSVKVGGKNITPVFDKDYELIDSNFKENVIEIPYYNNGIQQSVPYKKPGKSTAGSQERSLLYAGLDNNFKVSEGVTVRDHRAKFNKDYMNLMNQNYQSMLRGLGAEVDEKGNLIEESIPVQKIQEMLIAEAESRDYSPYEIETLGLIGNKFEVPLLFSTSSIRIQNLIMSLFNKRVNKPKLPGASYALRSDAGQIRKGKSIAYVSEYDTDTKLKPQRVENGEFKPAEIIIPYPFGDDMSNILDEEGNIDLEKIDDKLLQMFGYRIPTQGLNSMSNMKVVGFYPPTEGNVIIAPHPLITQTGHDFDIDKFYTYMYNHVSDENGVRTVDQPQAELFEKTRDELFEIYTEKNNEESFDEFYDELMEEKKRMYPKFLEDQLLKSRLELTGSTNEEIQKQIVKPLDFGQLGEIKAERDTERKLPSVIDEQGQTDRYLKARSAEVGIGSFSIDLVFMPYIFATEGSESFKLADDGNYLDTVMIDGIKPNQLNKTKGRSGKSKLDVIKAFQSASLDEQNEQLLSSLNITTDMFDTIRMMALLGFEEKHIIAFLNSKPVQDIYKEIRDTRSLSSKYVSFDEAIEKYITKNYGQIDSRKTRSVVDNQLISLEALKSYENNDQIPQEIGFTLLTWLGDLNKYGEELRKVQLSLNTDSSGAGKTFYENYDKRRRLEKYVYEEDEPMFENVGFVFEDTIKETAMEIGLYNFPRIFDRMMPKNLIENLYKQKDFHSKSFDMMQALAKHIASYHSMQPRSYEEDYNKRQQLFHSGKTSGKYYNKSLARIIEEVKMYTDYSNNLLKRLRMREVKGKDQIEVFEFFGNIREGIDDIEFMIDIDSMLSDDTTVLLNSVPQFVDGEVKFIDVTPKWIAENIIEAEILRGTKQGPVQVLKYISPNQFRSRQVYKRWRDNYDNSYFTVAELDQFYQNHPEHAFLVDRESLKKKIKDGRIAEEDIPDLDEAIKRNKAPEYIAIKVNSKRGYTLMRREGAEYVKIPLLGVNNFTELYPGVTRPSSLFAENNPDKKGVVVYEGEVSETETDRDYIYADELMDKVSNNSREGKIIMDRLEPLREYLSEIPVVRTRANINAAYDHTKKKIFYNPSNANESDFLEELIHAATKKYLTMDQQNMSPEIRRVVNEFKSHFNRVQARYLEQLSKKKRERWTADMLSEHIQKKLSADGDYGSLLRNNKDLILDDFVAYYMSSAEEFIAGILRNDRNLIPYLQTLPVTNEENFYQRIKRIVNDLLVAFGIKDDVISELNISLEKAIPVIDAGVTVINRIKNKKISQLVKGKTVVPSNEIVIGSIVEKNGKPHIVREIKNDKVYLLDQDLNNAGTVRYSQSDTKMRYLIIPFNGTSAFYSVKHDSFVSIVTGNLLGQSIVDKKILKESAQRIADQYDSLISKSNNSVTPSQTVSSKKSNETTDDFPLGKPKGRLQTKQSKKKSSGKGLLSEKPKGKMNLSPVSRNQLRAMIYTHIENNILKRDLEKSKTVKTSEERALMENYIRELNQWSMERIYKNIITLDGDTVKLLEEPIDIIEQSNWFNGSAYSQPTIEEKEMYKNNRRPPCK